MAPVCRVHSLGFLGRSVWFPVECLCASLIYKISWSCLPLITARVQKWDLNFMKSIRHLLLILACVSSLKYMSGRHMWSEGVRCVVGFHRGLLAQIALQASKLTKLTACWSLKNNFLVDGQKEKLWIRDKVYSSDSKQILLASFTIQFLKKR